MTGPVRISVRPAFNRHGTRLHGKFVVTFDGRQICISRQPLLDAARVLLIGDVKTRGDRQMAEGTVRTLPGVLGVQNQLRVPDQK
jgi:hypothetical protein